MGQPASPTKPKVSNSAKPLSPGSNYPTTKNIQTQGNGFGTFLQKFQTVSGKSKYGMPIFLPNGNVNPAYLAAERKDQAAVKAASKPQSPPSTLEKLTEAGKLFVFDPKMSMMCGMNICFGISAAYMNGMVTGPVVTYYLGSGYGGYLLSLTAVIAAMVSVPNTLKLVPASSKPYFMIVGPACFALIGLLPLLSGYDGWLGGKGLLVLYVLQGVGRGVWEATNKACFLSYFGHVKDKGVIGSNIIIQNGGASAIAFFMNAYSDASPKLSDCQEAGNCPVYAQEAWAVLVFSLLAIVGFLGASVLHSKDVHTWSGALGVAKNEEESNELSTQFK